MKVELEPLRCYSPKQKAYWALSPVQTIALQVSSCALEEQASLPAPLTQRGHSSVSQSENGVPVHKTTPSNLPRPLMRLITQDLLQQAVVISMGLKGNPHSPDTGNTV